MALPPLSELIKSRDVEDPVNLWLHRPLAYGFVALTYRTALTPNQVTLIATLTGVAAGVCWLVGTPGLMLLGGALLWTSSILDGADGILARAKKLHTELGRALDGIADVVVAAATVLPAFFHNWQKGHDPLELALAPIAIGTTWLQVYSYDFYKESYLSWLNPAWDGTTPALAGTRQRLAHAEAERAPWMERFVWQLYVGMLRGQIWLIGITNPLGLRHTRRFTVNPETARIYRKHNYGPLQIWTFVSLCPHSYLIAICGMFDRLDLYFWFRLLGANILFVVVLVWQRIATIRTMRDLSAIGHSPVVVEDANAHEVTLAH